MLRGILGVDWNGWHGVAAILVGVPGLAIAWLPELAIPYLAYRAITDAAVGLWAFLDDRPLGVLFLPTIGDAILHIAVAAVATLGIVARRTRRAADGRHALAATLVKRPGEPAHRGVRPVVEVVPGEREDLKALRGEVGHSPTVVHESLRRGVVDVAVHFDD